MADSVVTDYEDEEPLTFAMFGGGPTSQRPIGVQQYFRYFDTDLNRDVVWSGTVWLDGEGGPPGPQGPAGAAGANTTSDPLPPPPPVVPVTPTDNLIPGLTEVFYGGKLFAGSPLYSTKGVNVNLSWGANGPTPDPTIPATGVCARWTGYALIPVSGLYVFSTTSDNGIRLTANTELLIDHWTSHTSAVDNAPARQFELGQKVSLLIEWYQDASTTQTSETKTNGSATNVITGNGVSVAPGIVVQFSTLLAGDSFQLNFTGQCDHYCTLWYRSQSAGLWSNWFYISGSQVATTQSGDGDVISSGTINLGASADLIQFGAAACDYTGAYKDNSKRYVRGTTTVTHTSGTNSDAGPARAELAWSYPGQARVTIPISALRTTP